MADIEKGAGESPDEFLDGSGLKVGIAVARFNSDITFKMRDLCLARLEKLGVKVEEVADFRGAGFVRTAPCVPRSARSAGVSRRSHRNRSGDPRGN